MLCRIACHDYICSKGSIGKLGTLNSHDDYYNVINIIIIIITNVWNGCGAGTSTGVLSGRSRVWYVNMWGAQNGAACRSSNFTSCPRQEKDGFCDKQKGRNFITLNKCLIILAAFNVLLLFIYYIAVLQNGQKGEEGWKASSRWCGKFVDVVFKTSLCLNSKKWNCDLLQYLDIEYLSSCYC